MSPTFKKCRRHLHRHFRRNYQNIGWVHRWKVLVLKLVSAPPPDREGANAEDSDQIANSDSETEAETAARKARDEAKAIARKRARRTSFE